MSDRQERSSESLLCLALKKIDAFSYSNLVTTGGEEGHSTAMGGICTIFMMIFLVIFALPGFMEAINIKETASGQCNRVISNSPDMVNLITSYENRTMFAVGLQNINLNAPKRYFDISLISVQLKDQHRNFTVRPLETCNFDDWHRPQILINSKLNMSNLLCPRVNQSFEVGGKYSSKNLSYISIVVHKCNASGKNYECYNESEVQNYLTENQNFIFNFYSLNTWINQYEQQFIGEYLDDKNWIAFDTKTGLSTDVFFDLYQADNDRSLSSLPYLDNLQTSQGFSWNKKDQNNPFKVHLNPKGENTNDTSPQNKKYEEYLRFHIRKSNQIYKYSRSLKPVDSIIANLGGLMTFTFTIGILFMIPYNKLSFIINFYSKFNPDSEGKTSKKKLTVCKCITHYWRVFGRSVKFIFVTLKNRCKTLSCTCCSGEDVKKWFSNKFTQWRQSVCNFFTRCCYCCQNTEDEIIQASIEIFKQTNIQELVTRINDITGLFDLFKVQIRQFLRKAHRLQTIRRFRLASKKLKNICSPKNSLYSPQSNSSANYTSPMNKNRLFTDVNPFKFESPNSKNAIMDNEQQKKSPKLIQIKETELNYGYSRPQPRKIILQQDYFSVDMNFQDIIYQQRQEQSVQNLKVQPRNQDRVRNHQNANKENERPN